MGIRVNPRTGEIYETEETRVVNPQTGTVSYWQNPPPSLIPKVEKPKAPTANPHFFAGRGVGTGEDGARQVKKVPTLIPQVQKQTVYIPKVTPAAKPAGSYWDELDGVYDNMRKGSYARGVSPAVKEVRDEAAAMTASPAELAALERPLTEAETLYAKRLVKDAKRDNLSSALTKGQTPYTAWSPEEIQNRMALGELQTRTSPLAASGLGFFSTLGGKQAYAGQQRAVADALAENPEDALIQATAGAMERNPYQMAGEAHPISYGAGTLVGEGGKYALAANLIPEIPGVGKAMEAGGKTLSRLTGGRVSAELITRLLSGRAVDLPVDLINAAMETDSPREFVKNLGVNTALGLGTDVGMEAVGALWRMAKGAGGVSIPDDEMRRIMAREFNGDHVIREGFEPQRADDLLDQLTIREQPFLAPDAGAGYNQSGGGIHANDAGRTARGNYQNDRELVGAGGQGTFGAEASRVEGRRTFTEPAGTFIARVTREGKIVKADGLGNILAYKPAETLSDNAAEAREILTRRGFETFGYEGSFERSSGGTTVEHLTDAQTLPSGRIGLKNNAELPGKELAGHEGFHSITITSPEMSQPFFTTLSRPQNPEKLKEFNGTVNIVGLKMYGMEYNPLDAGQRGNIIKELGAQIGGKMDSDPELARELFADILDNYDAAYALWKKTNADFDALRGGGNDSTGGNLLDQLRVKSPELRPDDPLLHPYGPNTVGAAQSASSARQETSRLYSNTFQKTPLFTDAEKNAANLNDLHLDYQYDVVGEAQSLREAAQRLQTDYAGELSDLPTKARFDGADTDTAVLILRDLSDKARQTGDWSEVKSWSKMIQERGTEAGQSIQAFAKYSRTPEGTVVKAQKAVTEQFDKLAGQDPNLIKAMDDLADKLKKLAEEYQYELPADPQETVSKLRRAIEELSADKAYKRLQLDDDFADNVIKALEEGRVGKDTFSELMKQAQGIPALTDDDVMNIMEIMAQAEKLPLNSKARMDAENAAFKIVADKFNASFLDKWNAWRYMAMLGNSRTHIRNVIGNSLFGGVTRIKNDVGALLEAGADKLSRVTGHDGIDRTKSLLNPLNVRDRMLEDAAKGDFDNVYAVITGGGKYNPARMIDDQRTVFDTKVLEWLRKKNLDALEWEDSLALKARYKENLARYLKANGADAGIFQSTGKEALDLLDAGREYAIEQAQKATFRDYSDFASRLSRWSREWSESDKLSHKLGAAAIEGVVPFKKTPINIVKRGVEYSPAGIISGLSDLKKAVQKGSVPASKAIDELAAGLTGTGILALGIFLSSKGLLTNGGSDDSRERGFDALRGNQNYALKFGNMTYTLDWAAPAALPLFVGVELQNAWKQRGIDAGEALDALSRIAEPVLDMTMMQGLSSTIESAKYSGSNPLVSLAGNALTNYVTQAVPTLSGQITRALDPLRRTTYNEPDSPLPDGLARTLQRAAAKIPGFSAYLQPKTDQWGRTQENTGGSFLGRLAYNMLSPGYYSETRETPADTLLQGLYQETGDKALLPSSAQKSFNVEGEKVRLTGAQYTQANRTRGQAANALIGALGEDGAFNTMSAEDRAKLVSDAYAYATALGKEQVSNYKPDGWIAKAQKAEQAGIPVETYLRYRNAFGDVDGYEKPDGTYVSAQDQQADMLMADPTLTNRQKSLLDELMINDVTVMPREVERDFSSPAALAFSMLSKSAQNSYREYQRKRSMGFYVSLDLSEQEFTEIMSLVKGKSKKQDKLDALVAGGYSKVQANQIYEALIK